MTTLLIDADGTAFKAASAVQKTFDWGDEVYSVVANLDEATANFEAQIATLMQQTEADKYVLCFSCPSRKYFRHGVLASYKATRHGTPPLVLRPLKERVQTAYPSKVKPGLEADDVVGILATMKTAQQGSPPIIVSSDKDLLQIPGRHFNPDKPDQGVFMVTADEAERHTWYQILVGDSVDNYTGCPGIGPVRANRILDGRRPDETYLDVVLAAYTKAGLTKEDLAVQINVARILQASDYDFAKGRPRLWSM